METPLEIMAGGVRGQMNEESQVLQCQKISTWPRQAA